jgi:hypothetical protein
MDTSFSFTPYHHDDKNPTTILAQLKHNILQSNIRFKAEDIKKCMKHLVQQEYTKDYWGAGET